MQKYYVHYQYTGQPTTDCSRGHRPCPVQHAHGGEEPDQCHEHAGELASIPAMVRVESQRAVGEVVRREIVRGKVIHTHLLHLGRGCSRTLHALWQPEGRDGSLAPAGPKLLLILQQSQSSVTGSSMPSGRSVVGGSVASSSMTVSVHDPRRNQVQPTMAATTYETATAHHTPMTP